MSESKVLLMPCYAVSHFRLSVAALPIERETLRLALERMRQVKRLRAEKNVLSVTYLDNSVRFLDASEVEGPFREVLIEVELAFSPDDGYVFAMEALPEGFYDSQVAVVATKAVVTPNNTAWEGWHETGGKLRTGQISRPLIARLFDQVK